MTRKLATWCVLLLSAASAAAQIGGDVALKVLRIGPGGGAREGDWCGILVEYQDSTLSATGSRDILLRLRGFDPDGDPPLYERLVTAQGNDPRSAWIYCKLPMNVLTRGEYTLTAHEVIEDGAGLFGVREGRALGRASVALAGVAAKSRGIVGVVGQRGLGVTQYGLTWGANMSWSPLGHELTRVAVFGARTEIPDRWQGLAPFEAIVWGTGPQTDPLELSVAQARAVRQWVERGGHLVVTLPSVGQAWLGSSANPLSGLLPAMEPPIRREGVDLDDYRELLTQSDAVGLPVSSTVYELRPAEDAGPLESMPVLEGPDGDVLALRRVVGAGLVTLIGLDLGQSSLVAQQLPEAESFWHRVLGRRGPIETQQEATGADGNTQTIRNADSRRARDFDARIDDLINQTGQAALGVLLGLVLFVTYWLVAGPIGYAMLRKDRRRHAWVAYAATAVVFSAAAWTGATAIRPKRVFGRHVALLEQIHGQDVQRSRMWAGVLIPRYGDAEISVGEAEDSAAVTIGRVPTDLIASWESPSGGGSFGGFPDNRGYRIDTRAPRTMTVPVRQTVKNIRADWVGPARWSMPEPWREPGSLDPAAVTLELNELGRPIVTGKIVHELPGELEDVVVLLVGPQRELLRRGRELGGASIPQLGLAVSPFGSGTWPSGEVLDLGEVFTPREGRGAPVLDTFLNTLYEKGVDLTAIGGAAALRDDEGLLLMYAGLMHQFSVPGVARRSGTPFARRISTHGWDLGVWFTQPSVIVLGRLVQDDGELPLPLFVDEREVASRGETIVRWIYPLEPSPPLFPPEIDGETESAGD